MAAVLPKPHFEVAPAPPQTISPRESARYTGELLESLRKIALRQDQHLLAHLLELARFEAKALAGDAKL